jgi:hypothetical protein
MESIRTIDVPPVHIRFTPLISTEKSVIDGTEIRIIPRSANICKREFTDLIISARSFVGESTIPVGSKIFCHPEMDVICNPFIC